MKHTDARTARTRVYLSEIIQWTIIMGILSLMTGGSKLATGFVYGIVSFMALINAPVLLTALGNPSRAREIGELLAERYIAKYSLQDARRHVLNRFTDRVGDICALLLICWAGHFFLAVLYSICSIASVYRLGFLQVAVAERDSGAVQQVSP